MCVDPGKICTQVVTPYRVSNIFIHSRVQRITLGTAEGNLSLDVRQFGEPSADERADASPAAVPMRINGLHEGQFNLGRTSPREATGYSDRFSFDEAFRDAVENLPPPDHEFPDQLTTVTVTNVGALFGGIVGFNKMFVSVKAE